MSSSGRGRGGGGSSSEDNGATGNALSTTNSSSLMRTWGGEGSDWSDVAFNLDLYLRQQWRSNAYKDKMNIIFYLHGEDNHGNPYDASSIDTEVIESADDLIYYALAVSAEPGTTAHKMIKQSSNVKSQNYISSGSGKKLFDYLSAAFSSTEKSSANVVATYIDLLKLKMVKHESVEAYIAKVHEAVTMVRQKGEPVSDKLVAMIMVYGLPDQFCEVRTAVEHQKPEADTLEKITASMLAERNVLNARGIKSTSYTWNNSNPLQGLGLISQHDNTKSDKLANIKCFHCKKFGHYANNCPDKKSSNGRNKYWCDICYSWGSHSTDFCFSNPNRTAFKGKGKSGKGKGNKGKDKGKGGKGKGRGRGKGKGHQNFPTGYQSYAMHAGEWVWQPTQRVWPSNTPPDSASNSNPSQPAPAQNASSDGNHVWWADEAESYSFIVIDEALDFNSCREGDHAALFSQGNQHFTADPSIMDQLSAAQRKIDSTSDGDLYWAFWDSGASRNLLSESSPAISLMSDVQQSPSGGVSVGNGQSLPFSRTGNIGGDVYTTAKGLKYDLCSAFSAARRGLSTVLDFDEYGNNLSYVYDKATKRAVPLMDRGRNVPMIPLSFLYGEPASSSSSIAHVADAGDCAFSVQERQQFWTAWHRSDFDISSEENNDGVCFYAFNIMKKLSKADQDFLTHCRLGHLSRRAIFQLIRNGTSGITFSGHLVDLCRPCQQAKHSRNDRGGPIDERHPNAQFGEHLHSDLAIVNHKDLEGHKYVLTIVDEVSRRHYTSNLKDKESSTVVKNLRRLATKLQARTGRRIKTWQFDRGSEFLNVDVTSFIEDELGAKQLFSNIECPWQNGFAERSFGVIFSKARAMMKHADLPWKFWGRAILHATYLINCSPHRSLNGISPNHFESGKPDDLSHLRVFGCTAEIFVRESRRVHQKLSDRSEFGTFVGISTRGNGYIFMVPRTKETLIIDSRDCKFNETFIPIRGRQGNRCDSGQLIPPDLTATNDEHAPSPHPAARSGRLIEISSSSSRGPTQTSSQPTDVSSTPTQRRPSQRQSTPRRTLPPRSSARQNRGLPAPRFNPDARNTASQLEYNAGPQVRGLAAVPSHSFSSIHVDPADTQDTQSDPFDDVDSQRKDLERKMLNLTSKMESEAALAMLCQDIDTCALEFCNLTADGEPSSQKDIDAMPASDRKRYNDATLHEVNGFKSKHVIEPTRISDVPHDTPVYPAVTRWNTKTNLGKYVKTKCRICFGGHRYDKFMSDCFSPTVSFVSVMILLCLSAMFGWHLASIDYSQAYLNAPLDEVCFMRAPEFVREFDPDGTEIVWKLLKSIYGHPKSGRLWAEHLRKTLIANGFFQFSTDQCVYSINDISQKIYCFILIHTDDIIILSNCPNKRDDVQSLLLRLFEGNDNKHLSSFCGVEIYQSSDRGCVQLRMTHYWKKLMTKFGINESKSRSAISKKISKSDCPEHVNPETKRSFLEVIGSILFGFTHCRHDLAYAIGSLTRVMHAPSSDHLLQARQLLCYINATIDWPLSYWRDENLQYNSDFTFHGYVDASHADDADTCCSTGGWFFFLGPGQGCVASRSSLGNDVALSSTESETMWASKMAQQGAFIKQFLDETQLFKSVHFEVMEDSRPMINAHKKSVSASKFRHMKIRYHYLRQLISDGWCSLVKVATENQLADLATKILPISVTQKHSKRILGFRD